MPVQEHGDHDRQHNQEWGHDQHGPDHKAVGEEPDTTRNRLNNCHRYQNAQQNRDDDRPHGIVQAIKTVIYGTGKPVHLRMVKVQGICHLDTRIVNDVSVIISGQCIITVK